MMSGTDNIKLPFRLYTAACTCRAAAGLANCTAAHIIGAAVILVLLLVIFLFLAFLRQSVIAKSPRQGNNARSCVETAFRYLCAGKISSVIINIRPELTGVKYVAYITANA